MAQGHDDSTAQGHRNEGTRSRAGESGESGVRFRTTPTVRPVLLQLALVLLAGLVVSSLLVSTPGLLGSPDLTEIVLYVVLFVTSIVLLRLFYRFLILSRTTYTVRDDALCREFELFYRHISRELPYEHLWGHELSQSRIQALLRCGTLRFLTGGNHRGLGFFEFENVPEPEPLRAEIRTALQEHESESST